MHKSHTTHQSARDRGPYLIAFLRGGRLRLMLVVKDIVDYWNDVYDMFDISDSMIIQTTRGTPFTNRQVDAIWRLVIENMSEDGYLLRRRLYNRKLMEIWKDETAKPFDRKAYLQYKRILGKQAVLSIFGRASVAQFEKHRK